MSLPPSLSSSFAELRALVDEVADVRWMHPAWWGLMSAVALLERFGRRSPVAIEELYPTYLAADGGPHTDTFMGTPRGRLRAARDEPPAGRIVRAVLAARVGTRAVASVEQRLQGPTLRCNLVRERGWLVRRALDGVPRVAFITPRGPLLARMDADDATLVRALAGGPTGGENGGSLTAIDPQSADPTPAALAVSLVEAPTRVARHLHRQAWTRGGGPWLGIGDTPELLVASTCHLAVDGYGHALLVEELASELERHLDRARNRKRARRAALEVAAREALALPRSEPPTWSWRDTQPLGIAAATLERPPRFPQGAYAFARALDRLYGDGGSRFSPTFQVPVAPGPEDGQRRRRRVLHGLLALRRGPEGLESLEDFRGRARGTIAREMRGRGLLTRLLQATLNVPLPDGWRRRMLARPARSYLGLPPVPVLGGRGRFSVLRFDGGEVPRAPVTAVSAPSLVPSRRDPRGGIVLTLVHGERCTTATLAGTGLAGDATGAAHALAVWREELARLPAPPPSAPDRTLGRSRALPPSVPATEGRG